MTGAEIFVGLLLLAVVGVVLYLTVVAIRALRGVAAGVSDVIRYYAASPGDRAIMRCNWVRESHGLPPLTFEEEIEYERLLQCRREGVPYRPVWKDGASVFRKLAELDLESLSP
jgi:hypothetical protein